MNFELSEEQLMLRSSVRQFAQQEMLPTLKIYERERRVNFDLIKKMGSLGYIGAHVPAQYGGVGLDYTSASIIWEGLAWASWAQTLISLGAGPLSCTILANVASEEQKQKLLPPTCRGEIVLATAAVEPDAGSDASAIETTATLDGDEWVINGSKNFISGGGIADMVLVLVQTDKKLGSKGLALVLVEKGTPGFTSSPIEMVGDRCGELSNLGFSDCRVPRGNLIGQIGRGLQNSLIGIDTARLFVSAMAIGMAQSCLDACVKYAKERSQFGKPIGSFQLVQETIAWMHANIESMRWQVYYAAELKSKGAPHAKELSSAKWLSTSLAVNVATEAIKLHGAYGCTDDYLIEHHYRDAILGNILGGTTEMHKLTIGRTLLGINAMV